MQNHDLLIERITSWKAELPELCKGDEMLHLQCSHVLDAMLNSLRHRSGQTPSINTERKPWEPSPLTHVMGDVIEVNQKVDQGTAKPTDFDIEKLKEEAKQAYENFLQRDSQAILDNMEDIVIRAVAKMAGMDVSSTEPARLTIEFIEQVKSAIREKADIDAAKQAALEDAAKQAALEDAKQAAISESPAESGTIVEPEPAPAESGTIVEPEPAPAENTKGSKKKQ